MPEGNRNPDPKQSDPEQLAKLLEIELMQKRAAWQKASAGRKNLRLLSFVFLFMVIAGAMVGFYLLVSSGGLNAVRTRNENTEILSPTPTQSPR